MERIDIRIRVGLRIKQLRSHAGVTQDELAYSIGLSRSYLAEVETGKRNISIVNLERIVDGLDITIADFFDGDYFLSNS